MSTIWDHAVRAVSRAHPSLRRTDDLAGYYCGGPQEACDHVACRVVSELAEQGLLSWPCPDPDAHDRARASRLLVAVPDIQGPEAPR